MIWGIARTQASTLLINACNSISDPLITCVFRGVAVLRLMTKFTTCFFFFLMVLVGTEQALRSAPITSEIEKEMLTSLHVASVILLRLQAPARCLGLITAAEEITLICLSYEYLSVLLEQEPTGDTSWPQCFQMEDSELRAASLPPLMPPAPLSNPLPTVTQLP